MLRSTHLLQPGLTSPENTQLCPSCQNIPVLHTPPPRNASAERTAGLEGHPFSCHKDFCCPPLAHLNTNKAVPCLRGSLLAEGPDLLAVAPLSKTLLPRGTTFGSNAPALAPAELPQGLFQHWDEVAQGHHKPLAFLYSHLVRFSSTNMHQFRGICS